MWITEVGWSTYTHTPAQQAQYYHDLGIQVRKRPWIRALFSFCLREFEGHPQNDQSGYGLLKFGSWRPKPAYAQLAKAFSSLN